MDPVKREIDLRPKSRDLIRVRSEDLAFDPVKDRQQQQELKRKKFQEQQLQLQEHQRQWRIQQRKLQRRLQRRRQRLEEKQSDDSKEEEPSRESQKKRQQAWTRGRMNKIFEENEDSRDILDTKLVHVVGAPLEAHFLKGIKCRRQKLKGEETDSFNELSSDDDWAATYRIHDAEQHFSGTNIGKSLTFSTNFKHRLQCARCHTFYHYFYHGHYLATVRPHQKLRAPARREQRRLQNSYSKSMDEGYDYNYKLLSPEKHSYMRQSGNSQLRYHQQTSLEHSHSSPELHRTTTDHQRQSQERSPSRRTRLLSPEEHQSPERTNPPEHQSPSTEVRRVSSELYQLPESMFCRNVSEQAGHTGQVSKSPQDQNQSLEYVDDDFGFTNASYSRYCGRSDGYYVLVVVDDVDASTDPGSDNDAQDGCLVTECHSSNDPHDLESWDYDENAQTPHNHDVAAPPALPPRRSLDMTFTSQLPIRSGQSESYNKKNPSPSVNCHQTLTSSSSPTIYEPVAKDQSLSSSKNVNKNVTRKSYGSMGNYVDTNGNRNSSEDTSAINNYTPHHTNLNTLPGRVSGLAPQRSDLTRSIRRSSESSSGVLLDVERSALAEPDSCDRFHGQVMPGNEGIETRRRNFSSSSLPLSLMSATIEEVDDTESGGVSSVSYTQHTQRSHSYGGSTAPSPKVSFRVLRREARVPSTNSPPRTRRSGPTLGLVRSASDNSSRVARLRDLDIVGESYKSRFPWQRDIGVQCHLTGDLPSQPNLQRAMSGPALFYRSMSGSSNSPRSSPAASRRSATQSHSCSHSGTENVNQSGTSGDPSFQRSHRYATLTRAKSTSAATAPGNNCETSTNDGDSSATMFDTRRANFRRRPRPSSMGAVENIRYHHELAKFRELHNSRLDRKSDPQIGLSSCSGRKVVVSYPDDSGSVSDLESILESPGDRPWEVSRQMSTVSMDFEDDILRYLEASENSESVSQCSEEYFTRADVLPSPPILPRSWATFDDQEDVHDSDDSFNASDDQSSLAHRLLRRSKTNPPSLGTISETTWMEKVPLLESEVTISSEERTTKPASRLSMRRKLWKQNRKLKRGLTCDNILFKPPPELVPQPRRLSSGSITSDAESDGTEPDPPVARRGRRAAIYETKNCGDVSPTTLSPEVSPSNSCDEGEGASNIAERLRRRRSSVDLAMNIYPGDLLVQEHHKKLIKRNTIADFYAARQPNGGPLPQTVGPGSEGVDVNKKGRQPFSLLKLMKTRSKESLTKLDEILKRIKPSEFKDNHLAAYKSLHWSDLIASSDKQQNSQTTNISDTERKRREAVWELFKSECVFLIDHLMVLKHCFMEPLKKVQVEGGLMYAEPQDIFGNLDELSYVSYTFCKDFIAALLKDMSITDFGRTNVLLKAFQRFSAHSRDGAVYHSYCLNYTNALTYLEKLRANSEFSEFEKWCEQDPRCNRLQLTDLLVAPMQHCTKLPLLLHNVRKYTVDEDERQQVTESIEKVETSLKQLEEKMKWIKNFERVQEIQRQIVWPNVTELDPRCVIPESLKASLSKQPCEKLLSCPKRQLLHEGQITLVETPKPLDVHMFLFDDILLITKVKKVPRKSKQMSTDMQSSGQIDKTSYVVLRQPLALDRFMLHDISPSDAAASGLKHCFALVQMSRYQQITGVFTFQAACDATKNTWLTQIREAMDAYAKAASIRNGSVKESKEPKTEEKEPARPAERGGEFRFVSPPRRLRSGHSNSLRGVPTKSRSMDAVFI